MSWSAPNFNWRGPSKWTIFNWRVTTAIKSWHPAISWDTPGGGMALWLNTGSDSDKLTAKALTRGVSVTPESTYRLDGQYGTHLRLGFSGQTPEENNKALNLLFPRP